MDCWWNAAIENQGIYSLPLADNQSHVVHKSYRPSSSNWTREDGLRQTFHCMSLRLIAHLYCPVFNGIHYKVSNTIEGRILRIQKRKTAIVKEAFRGTQRGADPESIENLKIMFGDD